MIDETELCFPNNIVELIYERAEMLDTEVDPTQRIERFRRPLRPEDPQQSFGVYGALWTPDEDSYEMRGISPGEPTLQRYICISQAFVRDADEERGLATHSVFSFRVRSMLYRDQPLQVGFSALSWTDPATGVTERARRWGVRNQRFMSNEITGSWLYLSNVEFWLDTEIM